MEVPRLLDIPLSQGENSVIGINVIGLLIPLTISLKMLAQRKVPLKEAGLVANKTVEKTANFLEIDLPLLKFLGELKKLKSQRG